jgi:lipoprotein-releasing system ATP-binding protein
MNDPLISAASVTKVYDSGPKKVTAVDGINLKIDKGETIAIVGPSGAGKSTLLHLLGGLDRPTSGSIRIDGEDIYSKRDAARSRVRSSKIGFVFQSYHLLPEFTALENVMMPALIRRDSDARVRAKTLLDSVGLADRMDHRPGELSGGESQRVAIARALVNDPAVLLCDEPTGNLDSKTSGAIYELLAGLRSDSSISVIIVTHDESISSRSDRTIRMKDGRIA